MSPERGVTHTQLDDGACVRGAAGGGDRDGSEVETINRTGRFEEPPQL